MPETGRKKHYSHESAAMEAREVDAIGHLSRRAGWTGRAIPSASTLLEEKKTRNELGLLRSLEGAREK